MMSLSWNVYCRRRLGSSCRHFHYSASREVQLLHCRVLMWALTGQRRVGADTVGTNADLSVGVCASTNHVGLHY